MGQRYQETDDAGAYLNLKATFEFHDEIQVKLIGLESILF
jgi:hypothetical protein